MCPQKQAICPKLWCMVWDALKTTFAWPRCNLQQAQSSMAIGTGLSSRSAQKGRCPLQRRTVSAMFSFAAATGNQLHLVDASCRSGKHRSLCFGRKVQLEYALRICAASMVLVQRFEQMHTVCDGICPNPNRLFKGVKQLSQPQRWYVACVSFSILQLPQNVVMALNRDISNFGMPAPLHQHVGAVTRSQPEC